MAAHNDVGREGEELAEKYLAERGYEILERNWRYLRFELDLVAVKEDVLHFIEVKTRKTNEFGLPEEAVDEIKISRLIEAGEAFLDQHPDWKQVQFDVLSICMNPLDEVEYFLIEDVYF
jgi:putative endonuclease